MFGWFKRTPSVAVPLFQVGDECGQSLALVLDGIAPVRQVSVCEAGKVIWTGGLAEFSTLIRDAAKSLKHEVAL
jgi:hypothetical protein